MNEIILNKKNGKRSFIFVEKKKDFFNEEF